MTVQAWLPSPSNGLLLTTPVAEVAMSAVAVQIVASIAFVTIWAMAGQIAIRDRTRY